MDFITVLALVLYGYGAGVVCEKQKQAAKDKQVIEQKK